MINTIDNSEKKVKYTKEYYFPFLIPAYVS